MESDFTSKYKKHLAAIPPKSNVSNHTLPSIISLMSLKNDP